MIEKSAKCLTKALQYASSRLKDDRDIVLSAVSNNGLALQYASLALQRDKEIVLSAIFNNYEAWEYASSVVKYDKDVVLAAMSRFSSEYLDSVSDVLDAEAIHSN